LVYKYLSSFDTSKVFFAAKDWTKSTLAAANKRAAAGELGLDPLLGMAGLHLDSAFPLSREAITVLGVAVANVPHWLVRSPTEVLKIREQLQRTTQAEEGSGNSSSGSNKNGDKDSSIALIGRVFRSAGWAGLGQFFFGSFWSNVGYALPADVAKFLAYDAVVARLFAGQGKLEGAQAALAGALAGLAAQALTTPLGKSGAG
jgi:hypothetical protein